MNKQNMANQIVEARKTGVQTQMALPDPAPNLDDAMEIQALVFEGFGSPSVGWKVGAANEAAQNAFGLDGPFYGPMAQAGVLQDGADLKKTPCVGAVEPEYAFAMARDYPAPGEAINADTAASAVERAHVAIEVIGRCIGNADYANGIGVTMDFGGNAAFVVGPAIEDWATKDLVASPVEGLVDGEVVQTGSGAAVMGDPITSLVWMAQTLADNGESLKAGEWVSTGTCTPPIPAEAGKTVSARFGPDGAFGSVSVNFT
ncbi:MAG: fumarylacetoacetate hydrolase family protein [Pseudomonadota bacterium]